MRLMQKFVKKTLTVFSAAALTVFTSFSALAAAASEASSQAGYQVNTTIDNRVVQLSGFEKLLIIVLAALVALSLIAGIASVVLTVQRKRGAQ